MRMSGSTGRERSLEACQGVLAVLIRSGSKASGPLEIVTQRFLC